MVRRRGRTLRGASRTVLRVRGRTMRAGGLKGASSLIGLVVLGLLREVGLGTRVIERGMLMGVEVEISGERVGEVGDRVVERVREVMRRVILGGAEWGSRWKTLPGRAGVRGLEGVGCVKGRAMGRVIMGGIRQEVGDGVVVGAGIALPVYIRVVVGCVQVVRVR